MKCAICNSTNIDIIFSMDHAPIAGNFLEDIKDDVLKPLRILYCKDCGLAQVLKEDRIPKHELFDNYFYNTHATKTLKDHFYAEAESLHNELASSSSILEIGGNSCPLGERLMELGNHLVINVDPSNVALDSVPKGVTLVNNYFDNEVATKIKNDFGLMDVIFSANNFAHMEDLESVIDGIDTLLSPDGKLIIEVQDFHYLLDEMCFPFFYHEHLFYYTIESLTALMDKHGLYLDSYEYISIHGTSLHAIFSRTKPATPLYFFPPALTEYKIKVFKKKLVNLKTDIKQTLHNIKEKNETIVAYGASGQANIYLSTMGITEDEIPFIIDDSPLRQNKLTPGTHIPILDNDFLRGYNPDHILVLAYNFIDEIVYKNSWFLGKWLKPLPRLSIRERSS
jgi:methylation protein EvaC